MRANIIDLVVRMASIVETIDPTPEHLNDLMVGDVMAEQFIDDLGAGQIPKDGLMYAIALVGQAGDNRDWVLRGFLRRITMELRK